MQCPDDLERQGMSPFSFILSFIFFRRFSGLSGRKLQECKICLSGFSQHFQLMPLVYFVQDALQISLEDWKQHPRDAAQVLSLQGAALLQP